MKKKLISFAILGLIGLTLMFVSQPAKADQVIFSQYDGVNKWINLIINVADARAYKEAGVAYVQATDGYRNIERKGVVGVKGVVGKDAVTQASVRTIRIVTGEYGLQKTYNFVQQGGADSTEYAVTSHTQVDSTTNTTTKAEAKTTWTNADINALAEGAAVYNNTPAVEIADAVEEVKEVKAQESRVASREEPQEAKAIVVVPRDADMIFFALYFFDERITYIQLMDNYKNMHPLVQFNPNKEL